MVIEVEIGEKAVVKEPIAHAQLKCFLMCVHSYQSPAGILHSRAPMMEWSSRVNKYLRLKPYR